MIISTQSTTAQTDILQKSPTRRVRVLWFSSRPTPEVERHLGIKLKGSGYWINCLLDAVTNLTNLKFGIVTARSGVKDLRFSKDDIDYFVVNRPRVLKQTNFHQTLKKCARIVNDWQADIIHVHGTESFFGLLCTLKDINCPVVISVQGLLNQYVLTFFGKLSFWQIMKTNSLKDFSRGRGLLWDRWRIGKAVKRERKIISNAKFVLGRTVWDHAHLLGMNPKVRYFHVGEIMRDHFYEKQWDIAKAQQYSLIFTNARAPSSGLETLFEAVKLISPEFPETNLKLAGDTTSGYSRFLKSLIQKLGIQQNIKFLGYLNGRRMAEQLEKSHVFVLASCVENSPNSLSEAMLVGTPCVASYVGGVPSLIQNGRTGLLYPKGDTEVLAELIKSIFRNNEKASRLGKQARKAALSRHCPEDVVDQLLFAYQFAISQSGKTVMSFT